MHTDGQTPRREGPVGSRVLRALQARLAVAEERNGRAGAAATAAAGCLSTLDYEQMRTRFRGHTELIRKALRLFQTECSEGIADLEQRIAAGDFDAAADVAHRIKGAAGTVSAAELRTRAGAVESACREGDRESLPAPLKDLCREATRVLDELSRFLDRA
jgi:HPt (histidine-containing phosphotransfer) domain-containing protein